MGNEDGKWYSAKELAEFGLRGFPGSQRRIHDVVKREKWATRQVRSRGGRAGLRNEYQPPPDVQRQIDGLANDGAKPATMVIAQEPPSEYHGERSTPLLREVVVALDRAIQERQLSLDIELKADAIAMVYDLCLFTREPVNTVIDRVLRLILKEEGIK